MTDKKEPPKTAIVYDFDGTLSPGDMQEHSFIPALGYASAQQFWDEVKKECKARDGDENLTYMQLMIDRSKGHLTREELQNHGSELPLFNGVRNWFSRINEYANSCNLDLTHYVISSGIREMIEGCTIYQYFQKVFASSFAYDAQGKAIWPAVSINYTTKTQFLFRINKGIENTWDNVAINEWTPMKDRPIPFERMIFIGDGTTDIPSMKMLRYQGGCAIAVFDPEKWNKLEHQSKIHRLISEDRANYVAPADYEANSQLDVTVKGVLGRIARESGFRPSQ